MTSHLLGKLMLGALGVVLTTWAGVRLSKPPEPEPLTPEQGRVEAFWVAQGVAKARGWAVTPGGLAMEPRAYYVASQPLNKDALAKLVRDVRRGDSWKGVLLVEGPPPHGETHHDEYGAFGRVLPGGLLIFGDPALVIDAEAVAKKK